MSTDPHYQPLEDHPYASSGGSHQPVEEPLYSSGGGNYLPLEEHPYSSGGSYQPVEEPLYSSSAGSYQPVEEQPFTSSGGSSQQPTEDWHITVRYDPSFSNHVVGHTWLTIEAPDGHRSDIGFYPQDGGGTIGNVFGTAGEVRENDFGHAASNNIGFTYSVSRDEALAALEVIKGYETSSNEYSAFGHNCTTVAAEVLNAAGIPFSTAALEPGTAAAGAFFGVPNEVHGAEAFMTYQHSGPAPFATLTEEATIDSLIDHTRP